MAGAEVTRSEPVRLHVGLGTALLVVLAVGASLLLINVAGAASQPLGWALACAIVAMLVQPVITRLERHMRRGLAVLLTLLGLAALLAGAWVGVAASVADNVGTIRDLAPEAAAELEAENELAREFRLEERVAAFVDELDEDLGQSAQLRRSTSTASTYVVTGVLTVFFVVWGGRIASGALAQIRDEHRRRRIEAVALGALRNWRSYTLHAIAEVVLLTVGFWLGLYLLDIPAPFVLGLFIGVFAVVPYIGILIGAIPALLFAAADGVGTGLAVAALVVAAMVVEVVAARRRVRASGVYVGPALPIIVGLLGFELYGPGGSIYGVLLLVLGIAIVDEVAAQSDDPTSAELAGGSLAPTSETIGST